MHTSPALGERQPSLIGEFQTGKYRQGGQYLDAILDGRYLGQHSPQPFGSIL